MSAITQDMPGKGENDSVSRPRWVGLLLVLLPAWLIASGIGAMWFYFVLEEKKELESQARFARTASIPALEDDLRKIVRLIGERNTSSPLSGDNLSRAASMIEGTLGPSNTGYSVRREHGPATWPLLAATLHGQSRNAPSVWIVTSYDSRPGTAGGEGNASGLAATLAAAQALANDKPAASIHFVFLPHANEPESPVSETARKLADIMGSPDNVSAILCVEAMGAGESLVLSSRSPNLRPLDFLDGLGTVPGNDAIYPNAETDLAGLFYEMDLPAVRVATRSVLAPDETDDETPPAATVAASTGRLIELIRRCAAAPQ